MDLEKIIVAVDTTDFGEFRSIVDSTDKFFSWYKIHSIFIDDRSSSVYLKNKGKKVFLDLKIFDIPATMEKHVKVISKFADMFSVHLLSGREGLKRVYETSKEYNMVPVGVSVLTSFDNKDLNEIGVCFSVSDEVLRLVELGVSVGIRHFVCSSHEVKIIKEKFPEIVAITPGIRLMRSNDDQKRVLSPREAIQVGADMLVLGREITEAVSLKNIVNQLKEV